MSAGGPTAPAAPRRSGRARIGAASRALVLAALAAATGLGAVACDSGPPDRSLRAWSKSFQFNVSTEPAPPRARERTLYKVVVRDRETRQFIERGEGQIYATNADRKSIFDALEPGPEAGTYYAHLNFLTAGDWAVALRFRRDSTAPLETVEQWMQTVRGAAE